MAESHRTNQKTSDVDWSQVGDLIFEVLTIARDYPQGLVAFAREQSVPYESIVAAAITQLVSDHIDSLRPKRHRAAKPVTTRRKAR